MLHAPKLRPKRMILGALASLVAVALYWFAWADAWELVRFGGANSHVLLAPFIIVWLAWVRRNRIPHIRVTGRWLGISMLLGGISLLHYGESVRLESLFHLGALVTAVGAAIAVCGKGLLLRFIPVAFALLFLIPVPGRVRDALEGPLRDTTAALVVHTVRFVGPPAHRDGDRILVAMETPGSYAAIWRAIPIEMACDGLPMAMGLILITYGFVFATPMRNRYRWILLALSPAVILVYDTLRASTLVIGYAYAGDDPASLWRQMADFMLGYGGWLMLPLAFLVLKGVVKLLRWCDFRVDRYRLAG